VQAASLRGGEGSACGTSFGVNHHVCRGVVAVIVAVLGWSRARARDAASVRESWRSGLAGALASGLIAIVEPASRPSRCKI
jgi:hypothetical protein